MKRRAVLWLIVVVAMIAVAGWLIWRFTGSVQVSIEAEIHDLPFDAEMIPPVVQARPGEMVKVIYRIRNRDIQPISAFGKYEIAPAFASNQMQVFLTQCGGLNTFQNGFPSDYEVLFRVQPAGLTGSSQLALRHVFDRATPK